MNDKRILIVEDERLIAEDIKFTLKDYGYNVLAIVDSGEEAVSNALSLHPDCILMDIMIKGNIDGIQAAAKIKSNYKVQILFLSAYADAELKNRAYKTRPIGFLNKPFEEDELISLLNENLH